MVHLDYRDAKPIYTQIMDNIRGQIAAGILQPGEKLPSVREMAAQLSINPNTIQRSYRRLEAEGWIATVPGKGCFVCSVPTGGATQWQDFDKAVAALLAAGVTTEELLLRLKGGNNDA